MVTIAFIGLGVMGRPMAQHLLEGGHEVVAYRRQGRPDANFEAAGGVVVSTISEAAGSAEVVITMLPDSPQVLEVMAEPGGVFDVARPGTLCIDMSTIAPKAARQLADLAVKRGLRMLDAPVSGGEQGAIDASLSIMVGGDAANYAAAEPILRALGSTVCLVGGAGAGQTVKAANQLMVGAHIQALAEAIVFLEASGVDSGVALNVVGGGLAGSTVLARRGASMLARDFRPGFRLDLHHKDLGILTSAAWEVGVPLPIGAAVAQLVASCRAGGGGALDHTALLALQESASGRGTWRPAVS